MANLTSAVNVTVDSKIKKEATEILNGLGINMSTAINMFLTQVVMQDGIPFEVKNPKHSRRLRKALKEAEVHQERINQKVIEMLKSYLRP